MALDSLSDTYDSRGELQEAMNAKQQALSVFRENKTRVDYEYTALADVGHIYEELGEPQKALDYHFQALRLARSHQRRDLVIPMLSVVAGAYAVRGTRAKRSSTTTRRSHWRRATGAVKRGRSKLGNFYLGQGEYDKALQLFNQILPYFHSEHARVFEAGTLYAMGVAYHREGKLPQALEVLNQALSLWPFKNRMRREILREIGSVYQDLGDSPKALEYYEKSLAESRAAKDLQEEALTLCDMARSERAMRRATDARRDVEAGLQILESVRCTHRRGGSAFQLFRRGTKRL